jgi:hypothetical protein
MRFFRVSRLLISVLPDGILYSERTHVGVIFVAVQVSSNAVDLQQDFLPQWLRSRLSERIAGGTDLASDRCAALNVASNASTWSTLLTLSSTAQRCALTRTTAGLIKSTCWET